MDLKYKKEMEKHGLSYAELPEDAQTGIDAINDVLKGFNMLEKKGQKPSAKAIKKLNAMDKWVYYEILDYLHDTDKNDDDIPFDAEDVLEDEEGKQNDNNEPKADPIGLKIEEELASLHEQGVETISSDDLRNKARTTFKTIWDNYEEDGKNGVITSHYALVETSEQVFTLKKI